MNELDNLIKVDYKGQRVLTTQQLAESYETEARRITENFGRNASKFQNGIHYFKLENEDLRKFKENALSVVAPNINVLYLWTERGTLNHAKLLETDKAWEIFNVLVDTYFRVKELTQLKSPVELIAAGYQAALQLIEDMKPKAASFDSLISADGLYTVSDAAKILNYENAGPKKIFKVLEKEGFLFYKIHWCAYQLYINDGYFVTKTRKVNFGDSNPDIYNQVFVTPKGLSMLDKHFGRNGFKKLINK